MMISKGYKATLKLIFFTFMSGYISANQLSNSENFAGIYTGLGIGINSMVSSTTTTSTYDTTSIAPVYTNSYMRKRDKNTSVIGEIELGYNYLLSNNYLLGLSAFGNLADNNIKNKLYYSQLSPATTIETKKLTNDFFPLSGGIDLEPGYAIAAHTLFNSIIGWEFNGEKSRAKHQVRLTSSSYGLQQESKTKIINGIRLGIGVFQQLSQTLSIGLRYTYTNFFNEPTINIQPINTTLENAAILNGPFSYRLKKQNVTSQAILANFRYRIGQQNNKIYYNKLNSNNFNGLYISSLLGAMYPALNNKSSHLSALYQDRGALTVIPQLSSPITSQRNSPSIGLGLGFGKILINNIYLGLEGTLNWSNKNIDSRLHHDFRPLTVLIAGQAPDYINQKLKIDINNFEPSINSKLGFILPYNLFLFAKAGMAINTIKASAESSLKYIPVGGGSQLVRLYTKDSKSTNDIHLKLGAGLEYQYDDYNTFSLNYHYTDYGKYNLASTLTTTDAAANSVTLSDSTKIKLRGNDLTIGFTRYFNT